MVTNHSSWTRCTHLLAVATLYCACASATNGPVDGGQSLGVVTKLGDLMVRRSLHTATALPSGMVLIAGGGTPNVSLGTAELYDPSTGRSRAIQPLGVPRSTHTSTLLSSGKVFIVGGHGSGIRGSQTAELYDPATESFGPAGRLVEPHGEGHAAVPLLTGAILILGGDTSGVGRTPTAAAELYDPTTGTFTRTADMQVPRRTFGVVRLLDGRVLVAGGTTTNKEVTASAEIYDPATGRFTLTGSLRTARHKHAGVLMGDGRVLILGGTTGGNDTNTLTSVELYDPGTGQFAGAPRLLEARYKFFAIPLPDGSILAVGGANDLVEVTDGPFGSFHPVAGSGGSLRFFSAATLLADGSVLISGGYASGGAQATVWRFRR